VNSLRPVHVALAIVIVVVWGVNFVIIDIGLRQFPPLLFAALRFALVAIPGIFFVSRPPVRWRWIVAVGLFLGVGNFGLLFLGMHLGMPAGLSSLVLQSQAMFTMILATVLLHERLTAPQALGTIVATLGLVVIAFGTSGTVPLGPFLLVLGGATSWAAANVCTRISQAPAGLGLLVWSSVIPPLPLTALSLFVEGQQNIVYALTTFELAPISSLLYLVVLATLFGFGAWNTLLRHYPANVVAPYSMAVPVVGMASAWVLLGERPDATEFTGAAVILLGLSVIIWPIRYRSELLEHTK
jgi:O-acetylserine/cysteine efflux transporter